MAKHQKIRHIPKEELPYPLPLYITFTPDAPKDSINRYWKTFQAQQKFFAAHNNDSSPSMVKQFWELWDNELCIMREDL